MKEKSKEEEILAKRILILALALAAVFCMFMLNACGSAPELTEGERYFAGDVDFDYAESCTVSYILSADGKSIRDVKVSLKNYEYQDTFTSGGYTKAINERVGSRTSKLVTDGKLDGNGYIEVPSREITLRFYITAGGAAGEMDYRYVNKASESPKINIPLGTYSFELTDRTDTLTAQ